MKLTALLKTAALCACMALPAFSQGVPTVDRTSIAKLVEMLTEARAQLQEQIKQNLTLDEQTQKLLQQIALLEDQIKALRDGLDLAALGIGPDFLKEILPEVTDLTAELDAARRMDWDNLMAGTINGQSTEDFVRGVFLDAGIEPQRVEDMTNSDDPSEARIGSQANTSAFLSAAAESSAEDARESLQRVDTLVQKIPTTKGLKEAIDLNTRVTAELAIALSNVWAMEAAQTVGMGSAGVMDAATAAEEEKFIRLMDE